MEGPQNRHAAQLPRICKVLSRIPKRVHKQICRTQQLMRNKGKKFKWNERVQEALEIIRRELCEAPVLGMSTEKHIGVLDIDASVIAITGVLHQEQEWNGKTVLCPIAAVMF